MDKLNTNSHPAYALLIVKELYEIIKLYIWQLD